jgi:hypothetical protein
MSWRRALNLKAGSALSLGNLSRSAALSCPPEGQTQRSGPSLYKWDASHQILKKKAEARERRNNEDSHLQVVLQIVEHPAERKVEGNQDRSQDLHPWSHS